MQCHVYMFLEMGFYLYYYNRSYNNMYNCILNMYLYNPYLIGLSKYGEQNP